MADSAMRLLKGLRCVDRLEVLDPQLVGFASRVKWVTEADEAGDFRFIGHEARDPAAHRLAADEQFLGLNGFDNAKPGFAEDRLAVRRTALSCFPSRGHAGELEADDAPAHHGQAVGECVHERRIHAGASAVGQGDSPFGVLRAVEEKSGFAGWGGFIIWFPGQTMVAMPADERVEQR